MPLDQTPELTAALPVAAREVEEFVAAAGWEQPAQLFALVPTQQLLANEPGLADQVDQSAMLTPVAQEPLPSEDLAEALGGISWPETVAGCALVQEIVVLPPGAEDELPDSEASPQLARKIAAEHPQRHEARLVGAVLRDGTQACVMRVRGDGDKPDELIERPDLAPNLVRALGETFQP